jgi:ABC-2 type transport system permease protein
MAHMVDKNISRFRLIRIWLMVSSRAAQSQLTTRWSGLLFLAGKIARFMFLYLFLLNVLKNKSTFVGYSKEQMIVFYLIFNLLDIMSQFIFRGVYQFRPLVVSGNFDLDLLRPLPSFFRPIFGWTDILDLITLIPLWSYFVWYLISNNLVANSRDLFLFFIFFLNSLILAFSLHLLICAICLLTTEIDHLIMVYRDLTSMARFSTDIYSKTIQFSLTFIIPIIILMTVPTKVLFGFLSWPWLILSIFIAIMFLLISLRFWQYALKRYSSASS